VTARRPLAGLLLLWLAGCAAAPLAPSSPVAAPAVERASPPPAPPAPDPVIESPPIEPVAAPPPRAVREAEPAPSPTAQSAQVAVIPPAESRSPPPPPAPQIIIAEPTAEEREFGVLLADLQRYNGLNADELRRESQAMTQALARGRSDANRVRLAVLYTLTRQSAQDDQRALQLFETVAKSNPASASIKQLAAVLSVQVAERVRAVRDEQLRSEAALQKLEALRAMERSLLRDRVRSGGGGGGAGSGGGGN
jgi:hypothetical protein